MSEIRIGFWETVAKMPLASVIIFILVVFGVFCFLVTKFGDESQLRGMLDTVLIAIGGGLILFFTVKDHIGLPATEAQQQVHQTQTPTQEQQEQQELDNFLGKEYKKEYKIFSLFNPEDKIFNSTISVFVAERTSVKLGLKVGDYNLEGETLKINTLKTNYNLPQIKKGERVITYYKYEQYSETVLEDIYRSIVEGTERIAYSTFLNSATSRAYKLTVREARISARKKIIEDFISEDILSDINNILIDGIVLKKDGVVINVEQDKINELFNIGNEPEIEPPSENEVIKIYYQGEPEYNENIEIFDDIKEYRQKKGLDLETGFKNKFW